MGEHVVIGDGNWQDFVEPVVDGERKKMGLVPRDFAKYPQGYLMCAKPFDLPLFDESEWEDRAREQEKNQSSLEHIRQQYGLDSLDQDGYGYCWAFSSTKAVMYVRALNNQPTKVLSAWAVASIIKNYRDEGGWGSESLEWIAKNGVPTLDYWPQRQVRRDLDTPEMRGNAALHRVTEWMDFDESPSLRRKQVATCLLSNIPVVGDFNWWGHSVCMIRLLSKTRTRIDNSWTNQWSNQGLGDLDGSKAWPDAAIAPRVITSALN